MKVLLINGSPHKNGCTYTALKEVENALIGQRIDTEIFHIGTKPVHGCVDCRMCWKNKRCVFDDDPCNQIADMIRAADGVVIGVPVHFGSAAGAACTLLDRVFYSSRGGFWYKPGAAVVSCRRGGASAAFDRINKYFTINRMPIVSSQYWNSVHGYTPDDVRKDLEGMQTMRTLGKNMAWLLRSIECGEAKKPVAEKWVETAFIR